MGDLISKDKVSSETSGLHIYTYTHAYATLRYTFMQADTHMYAHM